MAAPVPLRSDFDAEALRGLAKGSRDPAQTRRLLALSVIAAGGLRSEAAKIGGVGPPRPALVRASCGYSRPMSDKLNVLLERLRVHQHTLILAMAEHDGLPAGSATRAVAELENVIAAVEVVAGEEADR